MLQILEDGILTDGKGRTVNFKNTILIMTSNVGSKNILALSRLESGATDVVDAEYTQQQQDDLLYEKLSETVKGALEATMKPELLNRMDEIVVFSPLCSKDLLSIADLILGKIVQRAESEQELKLCATPALSSKVMEEGSSNAAQFGARPMRRAAQRFFEDAVSEAIVRGFLKKGDEAVVDFIADEDDSSRHHTVEVRRSSDAEVLKVLVEKVSQGIGSSIDAPPSMSVNGNDVFRKKKKSRSFYSPDENDLEVNPV